MERDFDTNPYTPGEQRVADYLDDLMEGHGAGDDPIGFLIASHASLILRLAGIPAARCHD